MPIFSDYGARLIKDWSKDLLIVGTVFVGSCEHIEKNIARGQRDEYKRLLEQKETQSINTVIPNAIEKQKPETFSL